jgi:3-hydroxybutyryl-CoA dehydrogenase
MQVQTIGVVGAGQMGSGIAQTAAQNGYNVLLVDVSEQLASKAIEKIGKLLQRLVDRGKIEADARRSALDRIKPSGAISDLSQVDFAIEAATEKQDLKLEIVKKMDEAVPAGRIIASNTSSISITLLGAQTSRPHQVIGMHFMNPVPLMQLIEIIPALPTSDETLGQTEALAQKLGKTTVRSRDIPGFIVNRVLMPMLNEAITALFEGLGTVEDIDTACKLGLNHPMGPLALADLIGLDTCLSILEVLHRELGDDRYRPSPLLRQYVAAGWLGRKTGRGFHSYS